MTTSTPSEPPDRAATTKSDTKDAPKKPPIPKYPGFDKPEISKGEFVNLHWRSLWDK